MTVTALIADDEPLARQKLRDLAAPVAWLEVLAETESGDETIRAIDDLRPSLVFLDIEMPGPSGLEVMQRAQHRPAVIFTTAFDRYAVAAFELQALDYLLKPFGEDRFLAALERARQALQLSAGGPSADRLRDALQQPPFLTRFFVRDRGRVLPVPTAEIRRLEAQDDYVLVHLGQRSHLVHLPLGEFERRLDPARFVRVHRGHIVNLEHVAEICGQDNGRLLVRLHGGSLVPVSRSRSREVRKRIL